MKKEYKINTKIYPEDIINQAIIDFNDVSEISFNNWILVIEWDDKLEIEEIFNEFSNYIIWLFNEQ